MLISAVGFLNVPSVPDLPGLDSFSGPAFHSARWKHEHDLTDKRVAIVGSGSSAVQIVPEVAKVAEHLVIFQREPGWVMPKGERDLTPEERVALRNRWKWRIARLKALRLIEKNLWRAGVYRPGAKPNTHAEQFCRRYIEREFAEHPDLKEAVTPQYPYWGKRLIFASTYYPALKRANVQLVPHAVERVTETGVVDAAGVSHDADVIVLATGFQPTNYLAHLDVIGRRGQSLHDRWAGEPTAYLGITVPDFPNFFMMYGPGTNGGEIVWMLERQAEYAVRVIKRMSRSGATAVDVRPWFFSTYNRWLQWTVRDTAWAVSNNYFKSSSGSIVTQWPYSPLVYSAMTKSLGRVSQRTLRGR